MKARRTAAMRVLIGAAAGALVGGVVPAAPPAGAPVTHTIVIEAMSFTPGSLSARVGDRVVWINRDPFPHTIVSAAGAFRSGEIASGQSWHYVVDRTAVLPYACSLHPTMTAELRVE